MYSQAACEYWVVNGDFSANANFFAAAEDVTEQIWLSSTRWKANYRRDSLLKSTALPAFAEKC